MNCAVRYYTRSGNTEKLAKAIAGKLSLACESIDKNLSEKVDLLFLGCSYYAFDMDEKVKVFLKENKDKIGKIVIFGTSAMVKSMKKPMHKVCDELGIAVADEEFHCSGSFGPMHKGKPDADDIAAAAEFALKVVSR